MLRTAIAAIVGAVAGLTTGYLLASSSHAPAPSPPATGPAVARFHGGQVSSAQLRERLGELARTAGASALGPAQKRALADDVIRTAVLAQEATRRGLLADPSVGAQLQTALARRLVEKEFDENTARKAFSDDELRSFYQAHLSELSRPEKVHVRVLFLAAAPDDAALRRKQRQQLDKLRKELAAAPPLDPALFAARARDASQDEASRARGGDLGPLSRAEMEERMGPEFTQVAWLLVALGEVSPVIETPRGFYLARLEGREGALDSSFEQARESLRSRLYYQRRSAEIDKFLAGLKTSLAVEVDEHELEKVLGELGTPAPTR